jgi:hypothetical protein
MPDVKFGAVGLTNVIYTAHIFFLKNYHNLTITKLKIIFEGYHLKVSKGSRIMQS